MPAVLNVPGVIIGADVTAEKAGGASNRLRVEDGEALRGIVRVVKCGIFLNDAATVGVVRGRLA